MGYSGCGRNGTVVLAEGPRPWKKGNARAVDENRGWTVEGECSQPPPPLLCVGFILRAARGYATQKPGRSSWVGFGAEERLDCLESLGWPRGQRCLRGATGGEGGAGDGRGGGPAKKPTSTL